MTRIRFHEYGTQLRTDDDDRLILNVMCGRVAAFTMEIVLNDSECAEYRRGGDSYIQILARCILEKPGDYQSRNIHT